MRELYTIEVNFDLLAFYRKLIHIRTKYKALQIGDFKTVLADDKIGLFAFSRNIDDETVLVILNNSNTLQTVELPVNANSHWLDLLNDGEYATNNNKLIINIEPKWGMILLKQ